MLLMSAAYVHLNHTDVSKHTRNLSPASSAILLSSVSGTFLTSNFDYFFKFFLIVALYVSYCWPNFVFVLIVFVM